MEEVKRLLGKKVFVINEFDNDTKKLKKEVNKRKSGMAPGTDEVQKFWWKKLAATQKALLSAFK